MSVVSKEQGFSGCRKALSIARVARQSFQTFPSSGFFDSVTFLLLL